MDMCIIVCTRVSADVRVRGDSVAPRRLGRLGGVRGLTGLAV